MNADQLKEKLIEANKTYRNGKPIMSDQEFDALLEEYEKLVSADVYNAFRNTMHEVKGKIKHPFVMGSLDKLKVQEPDAIHKFLKEHITTKLNVSAKVDGISCRLHFENGMLTQASTRGDGEFGQDLTDKIKFVKNVVVQIPEKSTVDIRGELVIFRDDFAEMTGFANPRNACAGIMNRVDFDENDVSHVTFVPYTVLGQKFTKAEQFKRLEDWGFASAWHKSFALSYFTDKGLDIVDELFKYATQDLPYEIDGAVISDDSYRNEDQYRPDAQVAVKTNTLSAETTLVDVVFDGPSVYGQHVPVAIVEPVNLGGAMISRASLHNLDYIDSMGLMYGCKVRITKRGDIIPQIEEVVDAPEIGAAIELPKICNCCGSELVRDGVNLRCMNEDCEDQKVYQIEHFIKKLGVMHTSFKSLKNMHIDSIDALLAFNADKKYKSETKFATELSEKMFTRSKTDLFCSLTMKDVGETLSNKIISHYGWEFIESTLNSDNAAKLFAEKTLPEGIGQITLDKFLADYKKNYSLVMKIINDVRYHYTDTDVKVTSSKKNGQSVCFTGALNTMGRKEASKLAEEAGFEVKGGVSKGLTYLVTNDTGSGSSKNRKAQQLGTKIINEDQFLELVKKTEGADITAL